MRVRDDRVISVQNRARNLAPGNRTWRNGGRNADLPKPVTRAPTSNAEFKILRVAQHEIVLDHRNVVNVPTESDARIIVGSKEKRNLNG